MEKQTSRLRKASELILLLKIKPEDCAIIKKIKVAISKPEVKLPITLQSA